MPFDKRKAFGQHFLNDAFVIQKIIEAAMDALKRHPNCSVLEIGPGNGALTYPLMKALPIETKFYVAERDRELIAEWKHEGRIEKLIEGDFVRVEDSVLDSLGPLIVVSNLPYSAGTAIVTRLVERTNQIPEMVLMFQSEVAKRLYSESSTPDRGSLSLYVQNAWEIKKVIEVRPEAFRPPPKVMSEVVNFQLRPTPLIPTDTSEKLQLWNQLLKSAFQHRRKMLKGNLIHPPFKEALLKSGVDPTLRAESLSWDDWIKLWESLQ